MASENGIPDQLFRERTLNVLAAFEFGLKRQMFAEGLVYRRKYFWGGQDAQEVALVAHDGLSWAADLLRPMLSWTTSRHLSHHLRLTRTGLERENSPSELKALLHTFLHATRDVLAPCWTLRPWVRLGQAIGAYNREILLTSGTRPTGRIEAGRELAAALAQLPDEALKIDSQLQRLAEVARTSDFTLDLVELRCALDDIAASENSLRLVNLYSRSEIRLPKKTRRLLADDAIETAMREHQRSWHHLCAAAASPNPYYTVTLDKLTEVISSRLWALPDAPVFSFDDQRDDGVTYNGRFISTTSNLYRWLQLLDELQGVRISQPQARKDPRRKLSSNPLANEIIGADTAIDRALDRFPKPAGGARCRYLESPSVRVSATEDHARPSYETFYYSQPRLSVRILSGWQANLPTESNPNRCSMKA